jgi:hypothetical protein
VVGNPSHPLLGERPWSDVADLPIAAAAAGNHEFDDGVDALLEAARELSFPRSATGADAGLVVPSFHGTQAPLDGAIASLGPGPITELDVARLFGSPDYDPVIAELRPGELRAAIQAHWATADPATRDGDRVWWNWCRMPAAAGTGAEDPTSVAMIPGVAEHLSRLLDRGIQADPAGTTARDALIAAVG